MAEDISLEGHGLRSPSRACPKLVKLDVKPSRKGATLRDVKEPIDAIEKRAKNEGLEKAASSSAWMKQMQKDILDLAYLAWNPGYRGRVVHFFAGLLKESARLKATSVNDMVCWQLCLMSFSLSCQDVALYPAGDAASPVVVVAGYAGSHIDDLRPVAERWATHYGAAVVVLAPAADGMKDQLEAFTKQVMDLLAEGRPLILHTFSNGGLIPVKHLLSKWALALKKGTAGVAPMSALRCAIIDSAAIDAGDHAGAERPAKSYADVGWGPPPEKRALTQLYQSLGLAMLKHYGVIEKTQEELGVCWAMAAAGCVDSGHAIREMKRLPWIPFDQLVDFWAGTPVLLAASSSDQIVNWEGTMMLADHLKKNPGRAEALQERHPDMGREVLGEDGLAVHCLFIKEETYVPTAHAKHWRNHPGEYWTAVDTLAQRCLPAPA